MEIELTTTPATVEVTLQSAAQVNLGTQIIQAASTILAGKVELATDAEAIAGTDTERAITPANLAATMVIPATGLNVTTVNAATHTVLNANLTGTVNIFNVTYTDTGAVVITIPSALIAAGYFTMLIKDADLNAATNNITIATEGAEEIDEAATLVINVNGAAVNLYCDGSNLFIY